MIIRPLRCFRETPGLFPVLAGRKGEKEEEKVYGGFGFGGVGCEGDGAPP